MALFVKVVSGKHSLSGSLFSLLPAVLMGGHAIRGMLLNTELDTRSSE